MQHFTPVSHLCTDDQGAGMTGISTVVCFAYPQVKIHNYRRGEDNCTVTTAIREWKKLWQGSEIILNLHGKSFIDVKSHIRSLSSRKTSSSGQWEQQKKKSTKSHESSLSSSTNDNKIIDFQILWCCLKRESASDNWHSAAASNRETSV